MLIGTSVTLSTLHSHHEIEWDHYTHHADTGSGHCLTENSNICPICGYLFNANFVDKPPQFELQKLPITVAYLAKSQRIDPFTGEPDGRSPPLG